MSGFEDGFPYTPDEFKPKPYQEAVFKNIKVDKKGVLRPARRGRPSYIGVDLAEKGGDKTVIARLRKTPKGVTSIYFDEYAEMPDYEWWRNPIKWYKWRRLWKRIEKQMKRGKGWKNSVPF